MADSADAKISNQNPILVGRIGAAHGLRGQVRINSFTQDPLAIASYSPLSTSRPDLILTITKSRLAKNTVIAKLMGIDDRTSAEALNGVELFVTREKFAPSTDENEFLHVDLIGLEARTETEEDFGQVLGIANFGAGDLIEIHLKSGETILYPFTRAVVPEIHINEGFVMIVPPLEVAGEAQR